MRDWVNTNVKGESPVAYKARSRAEGKKIRFWRDGWRVLVAILKYRFAD